MVFFLQNRSRRMTAATGILILIFLLVACGSGSSVTNSNATATAQAAHPTPTPTPALSTYKGPGFTMKYPQSWKTASSSTDVAFADAEGIYNMTIGFTSNPNGSATADQLADGGIAGAKTNLKNAQMVNVPTTTTIGGQTWSQRAISGTSTVNGQSQDVEAIVLAADHPPAAADTKGYIIVYVTLKSEFDAAKNRYFTPMLQSFQFTS